MACHGPREREISKEMVTRLALHFVFGSHAQSGRRLGLRADVEGSQGWMPRETGGLE
jgi:hypothetical protein